MKGATERNQRCLLIFISRSPSLCHFFYSNPKRWGRGGSPCMNVNWKGISAAVNGDDVSNNDIKAIRGGRPIKWLAPNPINSQLVSSTVIYPVKTTNVSYHRIITHSVCFCGVGCTKTKRTKWFKDVIFSSGKFRLKIKAVWGKLFVFLLRVLWKNTRLLCLVWRLSQCQKKKKKEAY